MKKYDILGLKQAAKGNWLYILNQNGIDSGFLKNQNGPCPLCGGKDRWRWDNRNGDGGGFCHQCDLRGTGLTILARWLGLEGKRNFPKLLEALAKSLDIIPSCTESITSEKDKRRYTQSLAQKIWDESYPILKNEKCPVNRYFKMRGLCFPLNVSTLRVHTALEYRDKGVLVGKYTALVSKVADPANNLLGIHRTYLTEDGRKAPVREPKMALGPILGGAIYLDEIDGVINIAEGIETSLAVRQITNQATCAAVSATNLTTIEIPSSVKVIRIWADLDRNGKGEQSAQILAHRMFHQGKSVFIHVPNLLIPDDQKSADWLDFLNLTNVIKEHGGYDVQR